MLLNKAINTKKAKKDKNANTCGGVVKLIYANAPKEIQSTELIKFSCKFATTALKKERVSPPCVYSFSAEYQDDKVKCCAFSNSRSGHSVNKSWICLTDFMSELEKLLRERNISNHNGYYHTVSGLPYFFGSTLEAHFKSGEKIEFHDNQRNLLDVDTMQALCKLFCIDS